MVRFVNKFDFPIQDDDERISKNPALILLPSDLRNRLTRSAERELVKKFRTYRFDRAADIDSSLWVNARDVIATALKERDKYYRSKGASALQRLNNGDIEASFREFQSRPLYVCYLKAIANVLEKEKIATLSNAWTYVLVNESVQGEKPRRAPPPARPRDPTETVPASPRPYLRRD